MNIEILKESGVDYENGLARFSGNHLLYEKYLKKLLNDTTYGTMRQAALTGDLQTAFGTAHQLKAFIGNLSIYGIYEEIKSLTEEFRAGVDRDYKPDFEKLDQEYDRVLQAIESCS